MSSDLFGYENSFLYETFSPAQTTQEIRDNSNFLINETSSWEQIASLLLSSPPQKSWSSPSELREAVMEVKRDECQLSFGCFSTFSSSDETAAKFFMQRNYCQNEEFFPFDRVLEPNQFLGSPESICSNGDLQKEKTNVAPPFCSEKSLMEEANYLKVGRYSAEERKWRIDRYRAKRSRRNFNKTIKYACRKTLADGRQRIRGRFVRNDEVGQILDSHHFWIDD